MNVLSDFCSDSDSSYFRLIGFGLLIDDGEDPGSRDCEPDYVLGYARSAVEAVCAMMVNETIVVADDPCFAVGRTDYDFVCLGCLLGCDGERNLRNEIGNGSLNVKACDVKECGNGCVLAETIFSNNTNLASVSEVSS